MKDEKEKFEVICEEKDGELNLSVFEMKDMKTWIVLYRFFHNSGKTFYSLKNGIGFVGGEGALFELSFSVTAPKSNDGSFVESNVFINLIDGKEKKKILKMGSVTLGKMSVVGKGFKEFEKLLMSIQLPPSAKEGEYEGMVTVTLD